MSKKYEHLFFDLDHTLWDFEANSRITLESMYLKHGLEKRTKVKNQVFYQTYIDINNAKWKLYQEGKITKEALRKERFFDTFKTFGFSDPDFCHRFEEEYMAVCPHQTQLLPGAQDLLKYLSGRYRLHIITNGFMESQDTKITKSGIGHYFENVFSSEDIGVNKPAPRIFKESLKRAGAEPGHSIMIGDNLQADVVGASLCGIDQVYYNPQNIPHTEKPTFEVTHLRQVKAFL